jgi:DNA-binding MarR family transcriptional regulator
VAGHDQDAEHGSLLSSLRLLLEEMEGSALPRAVRVLLEADVTLQQLRVLTVLLASPEGIATRALAESCGVSMASMSTMADRLVALGVARRGVDDRDQRVRLLHVTALGRQVVQRVAGLPPEFALETLARLELSDLKALEQGVRALVAARRAT